MGEEDECIFCPIVRGDAPSSQVYEDEDVLAFMDIRPLCPGHTLIVPKRHAAGLADLDPDDGGKVFQVAQRVARALRRPGELDRAAASVRAALDALDAQDLS